MEKKLIELRKKLLFATKCIREHNDPMAADTVIGFSLTLINSILEKRESDKTETSDSGLNIPCVTQQRELLIAFSKKTINLHNQPNATHEKVVDNYIKSNL